MQQESGEQGRVAEREQVREYSRQRAEVREAEEKE